MIFDNGNDINRDPMKKTDKKIKQGMWDKCKSLMTKHHDSISNVSNIFYCEISGNFAHDKCSEQCNHCKKESESWED